MGSQPVGYSASRIGAILGLSEYSTILEAWQLLMEEKNPGFNAKKGYELPVFEGNASTRWGLAFEDSLCLLAEEKYNDKVINREKAFSKTFDNISVTAHIDGQFESSGILLENKTTNSRAFHSAKTEIQENIDSEGNLKKDFVIKKSWGEDLTDMVPAIYQCQAAIQRICSDEKLVRLLALVFPRLPDEWEKDGITVSNKKLCIDKGGEPYERFMGNYMIYRDEKLLDDLESWARVFVQIGNLHEYLLPTNKELEKIIIEKVQEFHENNILTAIPPTCTNYADVRRVLKFPQGTILADPNLKKLCLEYSELTRQLGSASPLLKRKEKLKIEINNLAMSLKKDDWSEPPDCLKILDPSGGTELATISKSGFRAKRAK